MQLLKHEGFLFLRKKFAFLLLFRLDGDKNCVFFQSLRKILEILFCLNLIPPPQKKILIRYLRQYFTLHIIIKIRNWK